MKTDRIILGIDPGTATTGYGLIQIKNKTPELIALGVIELDKLTDHYLKLQKIFKRTLSLIDEYHPDELAIEAPFFGKNVQSMLKLGRAQGVSMAAALYRNLPIFEYSPRKIKQAITGNGAASKEQVANFIKIVMKIDLTNIKLDATDGLAAAICHFYQNRFSNSTPENKSGSWKNFIAKNPKRVK